MGAPFSPSKEAEPPPERTNTKELQTSLQEVCLGPLDGREVRRDDTGQGYHAENGSLEHQPDSLGHSLWERSRWEGAH